MTATTPTVVVRVPAEVLVLAVRCALTQRSAAVAVVARSVRDLADELPGPWLADLDRLITSWLAQNPAALSFDAAPWKTALDAVRRARRVRRHSLITSKENSR